MTDNDRMFHEGTETVSRKHTQLNDDDEEKYVNKVSHCLFGVNRVIFESLTQNSLEIIYVR